jgi:hypothetical protein
MVQSATITVSMPVGVIRNLTATRRAAREIDESLGSAMRRL